LQSLAEPLKDKDVQMPNLPWTAEIRRKAKEGQMQNAPREKGFCRVRLHFAPCPAKKSSPFADNL
jgi:hypothetical protein